MSNVKCDWMMCVHNSSSVEMQAGYCQKDEIELIHVSWEDENDGYEALECTLYRTDSKK